VFDECCGSPSLSANRGEHVFEKDWGSSVTRELVFDEDCDLMRVEDLSFCLQDKSSVFVSVDNVGRKSTELGSSANLANSVISFLESNE
jgi:hypothetical protein